MCERFCTSNALLCTKFFTCMPPGLTVRFPPPRLNRRACMKPLSAPLHSATATPLAVWLGEHPVPPRPELAAVTGEFVDRDDGRFYRISQVDRLPPFLMTVVSAGDHWLFVASNGGLTAGRVSGTFLTLRSSYPVHHGNRMISAALRKL